MKINFASVQSFGKMRFCLQRFRKCLKRSCNFGGRSARCRAYHPSLPVGQNRGFYVTPVVVESHDVGRVTVYVPGDARGNFEH